MTAGMPHVRTVRVFECPTECYPFYVRTGMHDSMPHRPFGRTRTTAGMPAEIGELRPNAQLCAFFGGKINVERRTECRTSVGWGKHFSTTFDTF